MAITSRLGKSRHAQASGARPSAWCRRPTSGGLTCSPGTPSTLGIIQRSRVCQWIDRLQDRRCHRQPFIPGLFPRRPLPDFQRHPNNRQMRLLEDDNHLSVFRSPSCNSDGETVDRQGRLITCQHSARRVVRTALDGRITIIADRYNGKRFNAPNDVVVASDHVGVRLVRQHPRRRGAITRPTRFTALPRNPLWVWKTVRQPSPPWHQKPARPKTCNRKNCGRSASASSNKQRPKAHIWF